MDARVLKLYGTLETETGTNLWLQSFMALMCQNLTTNLISSHKRPSVIVKESNEEICDE